jgi:tetraprenyl-beta-curcumene synthase
MAGDAGRLFVRELQLGPAFVRATLVYWFAVFPQVVREIEHRQRRARTIPEADLRDIALRVLRTKRSNLEGAAAFATFAPRRHRAPVIRTQVGLQSIYDYVDTVSEQPNRNPVGNSHHLHQALHRALEPTIPHPDYYACQTARQDGRYLAVLVEASRAALANLPSRLGVAEAANRFAERIVYYQTFNVHTTDDGDRLKAWAKHQTPADLDVRWWETAASAGSSLGLFALVAFAAEPCTASSDIEAIECAYFPWIGALHSLLDNLVDMQEDARDGQRNYVAQYACPQEAAERMRMLAREAVEHVALISNAVPHKLILAGMVSSYLSAREAYLPNVRLATHYVIDAAGAFTRAALVMHRARLVVGGMRHSPLAE